MKKHNVKFTQQYGSLKSGLIVIIERLYVDNKISMVSVYRCGLEGDKGCLLSAVDKSQVVGG